MLRLHRSISHSAIDRIGRQGKKIKHLGIVFWKVETLHCGILLQAERAWAGRALVNGLHYLCTPVLLRCWKLQPALQGWCLGCRGAVQLWCPLSVEQPRRSSRTNRNIYVYQQKTRAAIKWHMWTCGLRWGRMIRFKFCHNKTEKSFTTITYCTSSHNTLQSSPYDLSSTKM